MSEDGFFSILDGQDAKKVDTAKEAELKAQQKQKRINKRAACSWKVRVVTQKKEQLAGRACNISVGGVSIELPVNFKNAERLYFEISVAYKGKKMTLKAVGEVVYSVLSQAGGGYQIGFKFMTVVSPYLSLIEQYVADKVEE